MARAIPSFPVLHTEAILLSMQHRKIGNGPGEGDIKMVCMPSQNDFRCPGLHSCIPESCPYIQKFQPSDIISYLCIFSLLEVHQCMKKENMPLV